MITSLEVLFARVSVDTAHGVKEAASVLGDGPCGAN
jgi:hypothetical protein